MGSSHKGNVIITKRLTHSLIDKLVENKDKCILHITCTGMGRTKVEPFVPSPEQTRKMFDELIDKGFSVSHVVLRIDPIIPTDKGWNTAKHVLDMFKDSGIKRVRFSIMDMYNHVKERFEKAGFPIPYTTFHAPLEKRLEIFNKLKEIGDRDGFEVEVCGEPGIDSISCLSQRDIDILGLTDIIKLEGNKGQRKSCHCPANERQLVRQKPTRCQNSCIYCYWK